MRQVIDPIDTKGMLEQIDEMRKIVESGEVLDFVFVSLTKEGGMYSVSSSYWAHKTAMIGAMHIKADEIAQSYNIDKLSEQLGI